MLIVCSDCKRILGKKPGDGVSHSLCPVCAKKSLHEAGIPEERIREIIKGETEM